MFSLYYKSKRSGISVQEIIIKTDDMKRWNHKHVKYFNIFDESSKINVNLDKF